MTKWTIVLLAALRIAVGWHFLYEGLWKIDSDKNKTAYATSWYTLHDSLARLRADLPSLAREPALARADAWYDEIVKTFKGRNHALADDQKARLADLRDNVKLTVASGADPVAFDWLYVRDEVLRIAAEQEPERFTSLPFLQSSAGPFRPLFRGLVRDIDGFQRLTATSAQSALDERYAAILDHYARARRPFSAAQQARFAQARDSLKSAIALTLADDGFRARLADYQFARRRVEQSPAPAAPFSAERLAEDRRKLDAIAAQLLGFVTEPLAELAVQAQSIATVDQLSAGPFPRPGEPAAWIDALMKFSLVAIGAALILGVATRYSALAAAALLAVFYFASPPWPGLPAATLGGHYLFVDRNFIELIAVLVIATTGGVKWSSTNSSARQEKTTFATHSA